VRRTLTVCILLVCSAISGWGQSANAVGNATDLGDNCYAVTQDVNWQLGAVWFNDAIDLTQPFEIGLFLNFGGNDFGADGMVFVMQTVGNFAIGEPGAGMGFEGFFPSFGIEMDTYQNADLGDIVADHVAIMQNGNTDHNSADNLFGPIPFTSNSFNIENNQDHSFVMTWDPAAQLVEVYLDCELRFSENIDLVNGIFNGIDSVWWGFTGATGGESNNQTVCISEYALGLEPQYQVCDGESIQLGVVGNPDGTFLWEPSDYLDDPTLQEPFCTPETDISYTVTFTDLCGEVTVLETEVVLTELGIELDETAGFCSGTELEITVSGPPDLEYIWSTNDVGNTTTVTEPGTYTVQAFNEFCSNSASIEVTQFPSPEVVLPEDVSFCEGSSVVLDATWPGASYDWSNNSTNASQEFSTSQVISVDISSADGCVQSLSTNIEAVAFPEPNLPDLVEVCEGQPAVISAQEGETFLWSTGDEDSFIQVDVPGTYWVEASNGDCTTTESTEVTVSPTPQFELPSSVEACDGTLAPVPIDDQGFELSVNGEVFDIDTLQLAPGFVYDVVLTDLSTTCAMLQTVDVQILPLPEISMPLAAQWCIGQTLFLEPGIYNTESYYWTDGDTALVKEINGPGVFSFIAENMCGTDSATVAVEEALCDCPLYVPTAITLNLDGLNDVFQPSITCEVNNYIFSVFDRWGKLIFQTNDQRDFWDGSVVGGGYFVPDGVYHWRITYDVVLVNGVHIAEKVGHLTVLR
jgi:gliding motility-associated-like protein